MKFDIADIMLKILEKLPKDLRGEITDEEKFRMLEATAALVMEEKDVPEEIKEPREQIDDSDIAADLGL